VKPREFHYLVSWRSGRVTPGAHRGFHSGAGQLFQRHLPFIDHPDPRRLDLRASLLDPQHAHWVRVCEQRACINVVALVDLSASMDFCGRHDKFQDMAAFLSCLANSAHRNGDRLGIVACSDRASPEFHLPPTRHPGAVRELIRRLRASRPLRGNARGLLNGARYIPPGRALVFVLSDFHYPLVMLRKLMAGLAEHQVVPVVFWDQEELSPQAQGLGYFQDSESGAERLMWLRPDLRRRLAGSFRERRERLGQVLRSFSSEPLFLRGGFEPDQVSEYFLSRP
jgi:hypothetical protein